jgi:hypothetical protein
MDIFYPFPRESCESNKRITSLGNTCVKKNCNNLKSAMSDCGICNEHNRAFCTICKRHVSLNILGRCHDCIDMCSNMHCNKPASILGVIGRCVSCYHYEIINEICVIHGCKNIISNTNGVDLCNRCNYKFYDRCSEPGCLTFLRWSTVIKHKITKCKKHMSKK